jgi:hypothetical protein
MLNDFFWAVAAALTLGLLGVILAKPRRLLTAWLGSGVGHTYRKLFKLERLERLERANERQAAYLTQCVCNQEGNPDDEFRADWYRWFMGDPDANVDYKRKQQRDLERPRRGDFSVRANG